MYRIPVIKIIAVFCLTLFFQLVLTSVEPQVSRQISLAQVSFSVNMTSCLSDGSVYEPDGGQISKPIDKIKLYLNNSPFYLNKPIFFWHGRYYIAELDCPIFELPVQAEASDPVKALIINNLTYFSLFDICERLGYVTDWNYDTKTISLFSSPPKSEKYDKVSSFMPALLRFEDVAASDVKLIPPDCLLKHRIVYDYLYQADIPFAISWVPRYINPALNIDNDLAHDYSMYNSEFIFTMDYALIRGGQLGLHGYTHQYGMEKSLEGTEFSSTVNNTEYDTRSRIELAIARANYLDWEYCFFEFPHYSASLEQYHIAEDYFSIIYQNYYEEPKYNANILVVKSESHPVFYIPTSLGYISSDYPLEKMLNSINNLNRFFFASLFLHMNYELPFVNIQRSNLGPPTADYYKNSPLHEIISALEEKGRSFVTLESLKEPI